ncbi:Crp/Fnr family transcriptional regulator [Novosphingobium jiangmenense]|uniref:Crp/Fnr family transcriptional regulator n=1 Tax=Novosphingobium jiangmenense TaxID=2791981 RepID=UPI001FE59FCA|nr:Crp/Fnr family transcriptional regulator [Novosphingobium jiangmenense]
MEAPSSVRHFRRQQHLARPGETRDSIYRVEEGWACRYCLLPDGRRQIAALYLPGDYCEPHWLLSGRADLPVMAMTGLRVREVPLASIHTRPGDGVKRLLGAMVQTLERQSKWIVSLGRKTAVERVSELLGELFERLRENERSSDEFRPIQLTQRDIADVVGLTPVHVNRVLQGLRQRGLVELRGRTLMVRAGDP